MARRILSADAALVPQPQNSLDVSVRTETDTLPLSIRSRWIDRGSYRAAATIFDWEDRTQLMQEIAFVNRAQDFLDEAAIKIAPSVLRIVLTVKQNLADAPSQREFLREHLALDFRRISELCITAESYRLTDSDHAAEGEKEISRYGWSKALKLAHVRDANDRRDIWRRACGKRKTASYRAVLEEIRRFRGRKLISPAPQDWPMGDRLSAARSAFANLDGMSKKLHTRHACQDALRELGRVQKELVACKRALNERIESLTHEEMAAEA